MLIIVNGVKIARNFQDTLRETASFPHEYLTS